MTCRAELATRNLFTLAAKGCTSRAMILADSLVRRALCLMLSLLCDRLQKTSWLEKALSRMLRGY